MERAGYPLYFPLLQRRHFTAGDSRRGASQDGGLYLCLFRTRVRPSLAFNDFKVVAENRFANPWRRRIEAASYTGTSISLRIAPARLCLFLSLVIYNGFSLFFSKLRKSYRLLKLIATSYNYTHTKHSRKLRRSV